MVAHNFVDRTGQKYNNLTCLSYERRNGVVYWKCQCDCGNITYTRTGNLRSGAVKSCGCRKKGVNKVHGLSQTRLHKIWSKMLSRCENPNADSYKYYGGEGKKVCDEWHGTDGFIRFYEWAMANGYSDDLSIDRIDINGNYEPSNCRWIPLSEQHNNTRSTVWINYKGKLHTLNELYEEYKVSKNNIYQRLRAGWDIEEALEIKPHKRRLPKQDEKGRFLPKQ